MASKAWQGPDRVSRQRASPIQTAVRNCTGDEGRPFEVQSGVDLKSPQAAVVKSNGGEGTVTVTLAWYGRTV